MQNLRFNLRTWSGRLGLAGLFLSILTVGCSPRTVTRISPDQTIDLSGRWNDSDSKMVSKEMIEDVINRPWKGEFEKAFNRKPVVVVGIVSNRSSEHIDSSTFIKDIERSFVNSGSVRLVQNAEFREKMREERAEQSEFASPSTQAKWGKELGADFMMFGTITSTTDSYRKEKVVNYKINLELSNLETNEKVWIGDKEIKKFIKN